jgi:hypothetical protein
VSADTTNVRLDYTNHDLHSFTSLNVDDSFSNLTDRNLTKKPKKSNIFAQAFHKGEKYGQAEVVDPASAGLNPSR